MVAHRLKNSLRSAAHRSLTPTGDDFHSSKSEAAQAYTKVAGTSIRGVEGSVTSLGCLCRAHGGPHEQHVTPASDTGVDLKWATRGR
jgi:hypothetical protein